MGQNNRPASPAEELAFRQQLMIGARQSALNAVLELYKAYCEKATSVEQMPADKFVEECRKIEEYILKDTEAPKAPTIVKAHGFQGH